jgi:Tfp pilus assembly protein PilF
LTAERLEPAAASPRLQEALVYERLGATRQASDAIAQAIDRERTNWTLWLTASRIATEADQPKKALADYRRARDLNPASPLFAR